MSKATESIIADREDYYAANKIANAISDAQSIIRRTFMDAFNAKILEKFHTIGIVSVSEEILKSFKYDKNVERGECLAYEVKGKYFLVWAITSLYWQLGNSCKYEKEDKWSYINKEWFNGVDAAIDKDESSGYYKKVDTKYLKDEGNKIVELYL